MKKIVKISKITNQIMTGSFSLVIYQYSENGQSTLSLEKTNKNLSTINAVVFYTWQAPTKENSLANTDIKSIKNTSTNEDILTDVYLNMPEKDFRKLLATIEDHAFKELTASNKIIIKMSKAQWQQIGKQAGWFDQFKKTKPQNEPTQRLPTPQSPQSLQSPQSIQSAKQILFNIKTLTNDIIKLSEIGAHITFQKLIKKAEELYHEFHKLTPYAHQLKLSIINDIPHVLPFVYEIMKHKKNPNIALTPNKLLVNTSVFENFYRKIAKAFEELNHENI